MHYRVQTCANEHVRPRAKVCWRYIKTGLLVDVITGVPRAPSENYIETHHRSREKLEKIRQSRPDFGLGLSQFSGKSR
jgi:hypothetical protein